MLCRERCKWRPPPRKVIVIVLMMCALLFGAASVPAIAADAETALIVRGPGADDTGLAGKLAAQLSGTGYEVTVADYDSIEPVGKTRIAGHDLLVLCDSSSLPLAFTKSIVEHAAAGGDVIALRTPAWRSVLLKRDGKWVDREKYLSDTAFSKPDNILMDHRSKSAVLSRESAAGGDLCTWGWSRDPVANAEVLNVNVTDLQGFEFLSLPEINRPFPDGHTVTVLAAKGGERTAQLAVRWRDTDGALWTSIIRLDPGWKRYLLRPGDFHWAGGTDAHKKEGFNPSKALVLSVGLSWGDTGQILGRHNYSIGYVGTAREAAEDAELHGSVSLPDLDTLSPTYKLFPVTNAAEFRTDAAFASGEGVRSIPLASDVYSPHTRPQAHGFDKGREWRWAPIINSYTADGKWCGAPAVMTVYSTGGFAGSAWASFGVNDPKWYSRPEVLRVIGDVARRIKSGVFIMDGGADFYTYTKGQEIRLGLSAANIGKSVRSGLTARVTLTDADTRKVVRSEEWPLEIQPGTTVSQSASLNTDAWPKGGFTVRAELLDNGRSIDSVEHDISLWQTKPNPSFVTCKDGEFYQDGRLWRPHGVNYYPSSTVATQDYSLFLEWFGKRSYDPVVIERDLANIRAMGMDAVSVQVWYSKPPLTDNLLDFLRRAEKHGIKVNLAIPMTPMTKLEERWAVYKKVVTDYDLKDVDTIFAYDVDWEPIWNTPEYRKQWDAEWAEWVIERYGSIENAERDWQFPIPRDASGKVTNPPVNHIQADGEWRRMSAAYLRFLNTVLYKRYAQARDLIREVDPNHLVSFRMHAAGDGGSGWYGLLVYDWPYLAAAVDFFSPEAYSLGHTYETIKRGIFTRAYGRWADPEKPVVYAETGYNLLEYPGLLTPRPNADKHQEEFFESFYKMMRAGSVNGVFWWWYPGGFRCGEASDYGIINPDGSDRPSTRIIRREARNFSLPTPLRQGPALAADPDAFISSSMAGSIYHQTKDAFWRAIEGGELPTIASDGIGTTSADCPLVAVGNTSYNGSNPPKHLDASIDSVKLSQNGVEWVKVGKGASFAADASKPVMVALKLTNLGRARWLSRRSAAGAVVVVVEAGAESRKLALPRDIPSLKSIELEPFAITPLAAEGPVDVKIRIEAEERAVFGERWRFTLKYARPGAG